MEKIIRMHSIGKKCLVLRQNFLPTERRQCVQRGMNIK